MKSVLKLVSERVINVPECKRMLSQILPGLLSEKSTDPGVLLCILDIIKGWIEDDVKQSPSALNALLNQKDIISYLQKLSQVDRQNFSASALEEWETKYLQLLYGICADSSK